MPAPSDGTPDLRQGRAALTRGPVPEHEQAPRPPLTRAQKAVAAVVRAWPYLRWVVALGLLGLIVYVLVGRSAELSSVGSYLAGVRGQWLVVAVLLEACAIVSFAALQRRLLLSGQVGVGMGPLTAITLAGNSINNSLPGGTAFASVYAFRQYRLRGADDTLAAWTVLAVGIFAGAALALLASAGLVISGAEGGLDLIGYTLLTLVAGMAFGAAAVAVLWRLKLLVKVFRWAVGFVEHFVPMLRGDPNVVARRIVTRLTVVRPRKGAIAFCMAWAMGNWVCDCGCLAFSFIAVGAPVPWRSLLLAYGAGQLAANLPITPGGLGVVEGSMTIALVAYGGAEASTVAAVLLYRIINFWASLPVGWSAFGALAVQERGRQARSAPVGERGPGP